jgi:hypothetical protein
LYAMCFNNANLWIDYLGREPVRQRTINILPRQDTSIKQRDKATQENLEKKFDSLMTELNRLLDCCCTKYKIACDVDAVSVFPRQTSPQAPADGDYSGTENESKNALGKAEGNNIPVTFTNNTIKGSEANAGMAAKGTGILLNKNGDAPAMESYVLAHELGHVADYKGNDPGTNHDVDNTPSDIGSAGDSVMAPRGGDLVTEEWCKKVGGLAK